MSYYFQPIHPWVLIKEPQTDKFAPHNLTLDFTSRKPNVIPKMFDGSYSMAENRNQKESEISIYLQNPNYKRPHKLAPKKLEATEPNIKNDLKQYFEDDHLENLKANSLQQGEDNAPMGDHSGDHDQDLLKSLKVQKVLQSLRDHIAG